MRLATDLVLSCCVEFVQNQMIFQPLELVLHGWGGGEGEGGREGGGRERDGSFASSTGVNL